MLMCTWQRTGLPAWTACKHKERPPASEVCKPRPCPGISMEGREGMGAQSQSLPRLFLFHVFVIVVRWKYRKEIQADNRLCVHHSDRTVPLCSLHTIRSICLHLLSRSKESQYYLLLTCSASSYNCYKSSKYIQFWKKIFF